VRRGKFARKVTIGRKLWSRIASPVDTCSAAEADTAAPAMNGQQPATKNDSAAASFEKARVEVMAGSSSQQREEEAAIIRLEDAVMTTEIPFRCE
jgi:hypothetical protein